MRKKGFFYLQAAYKNAQSMPPPPQAVWRYGGRLGGVLYRNISRSRDRPSSTGNVFHSRSVVSIVDQKLAERFLVPTFHYKITVGYHRAFVFMFLD